jgi:hypothetical protein
MGFWNRLTSALGDRRVVPQVPPGQVSFIPSEEFSEPDVQGRADRSAAWSAFITYIDSKGDESARVITLRSISGPFGKPDTIGAFCHERKAHRAFKVANISSMICTVTGELLDPLENCMALHRSGALKIDDIVLTRVMRVIMFIAKCDGELHPMERAALENLLGRYNRFFGGDDDSAECAISEAPRLAPSSGQFISDLRWIKTTAPLRGELCRFLLDSTASIIDADGRHADEEIDWALEVSAALKRSAGRK